MSTLFTEHFSESCIGSDTGNARNHQYETNAVIFHIVQQTYNRANLFTYDAAKHRDSLFKRLCAKYEVVPLANVIMPNHTHDLVLTNDFSKLQKVVRYTNRGTSAFINHEREDKNFSRLKHVFDFLPGYVPVKSRYQLFYLLRYLYQNPTYLFDEDMFVPYSCFKFWEKGYIKPYKTEVLTKALDLTLEKLLAYCKGDGEEFNLMAKVLYMEGPVELDDKIFKKDPSKPWMCEKECLL